MSELIDQILTWLAASGTLVVVAGAAVAAILKWTGLGSMLTAKQKAVIHKAAADGMQAVLASAHAQIAVTDGWASKQEFKDKSEQATEKFNHSVAALQEMFPDVAVKVIEEHVEAAWRGRNEEKLASSEEEG